MISASYALDGRTSVSGEKGVDSIFSPLFFLLKKKMGEGGKRAMHLSVTLDGGGNGGIGGGGEGTTRAFANAAAAAAQRDQSAASLAKNQISVAGSISGAESLSRLDERGEFIPMRLSDEERDFLRLLEGALRVSEYTDHVDVTSHDYGGGWGWSFGGHTVSKKETKMQKFLSEFLRILLGLHLCFDFKEGQKRIKQEVIRSKDFFLRAFEVGRRYKIMNPDRMRSTYGKLMCILQDCGSAEVDLFRCDQPVLTVKSFLESKGCLGMLQDSELLEKAADVGDVRVMGQEEQKRASTLRQEAIQTLRTRFVGNGRLTEEELMRVINSVQDGNAYVAGCRHPVDKMINYLKHYFDPTDPRDDNHSLAIQTGKGGSCLTHNHATQYKFVMQSLQLWREIQNQMYRLWKCADADLQDQTRPYRLFNTGQGLHRVQSAPRVGSAMMDILSTVKSRCNGWVGLSVVHLGDRDVPNALVFIDKYTQVPRILGPIVMTLERIGIMCEEDPLFKEHIDREYRGVEALRTTILRDFFRHGFDGSGDDGGSCVDGRLTSAWNWCAQLAKKHYEPIFLLTGFTGFDGDFRQ